MACSLLLNSCMLFFPSRVILIEFLAPNNTKRSIFYAILLHTSQSTSHTSPCIGFLNRNHSVKVSKGLPSFEDHVTSRLKSLFHAFSLLIWAAAVPSQCCYSRKGRQQGARACEVQHMSLNAAAMEFPGVWCRVKIRRDFFYQLLLLFSLTLLLKLPILH